ncbi:hypothetical protein ACM66Z_08545 [Sulfurovum sp. ST-21]|uniref:Uncharacterized protein n=1 Tax=Sulfurovum indicum TaxID=2779528 RepID=A0A7M1S235_9BACT|nr:hypothetical protein [Sulfurovum indicum]QOR61477.1 hypothetical protein IMZ28_08535 [Sulfurovum indicum]
MKLMINILVTTFLTAGFFNTAQESEKAEMMENARLCKLFTEKVQKYQATMRDDRLAKTTLASYEQRASLFCSKRKTKANNTAR